MEALFRFRSPVNLGRSHSYKVTLIYSLKMRLKGNIVENTQLIRKESYHGVIIA